MTAIKETIILEGRAAIVSVRGALNGTNSLRMEDYFLGLAGRGIHYILLDAKEISYISSSGIGLIVSVMKIVESKNGLFTLFNCNNEIRSLFNAIGIDKRLNIAANQTEAVAMAERLSLAGSGEGLTKRTVNCGTAEPSAPLLYNEPLLIECRRCAALIRVKAPGDYICPDCESFFRAAANMNIIFA
jgi:anti-sigma B factor antagonist